MLEGESVKKNEEGREEACRLGEFEQRTLYDTKIDGEMYGRESKILVM